MDRVTPLGPALTPRGSGPAEERRRARAGALKIESAGRVPARGFLRMFVEKFFRGSELSVWISKSFGRQKERAFGVYARGATLIAREMQKRAPSWICLGRKGEQKCEEKKHRRRGRTLDECKEKGPAASRPRPFPESSLSPAGGRRRFRWPRPSRSPGWLRWPKRRALCPGACGGPC